jgi:integrase
MARKEDTHAREVDQWARGTADAGGSRGDSEDEACPDPRGGPGGAHSVLQVREVRPVHAGRRGRIYRGKPAPTPLNERLPTGIRRHGDNLYIRFYDQHGQRQEEKVGPKLETAVLARAKRLVQVAEGKFEIKRPGRSATFHAFVDGSGEWRRQIFPNLKPSTQRSYEMGIRVHLDPFFGDMPLAAITRPDVLEFIATKNQERRHAHTPLDPNPDRPIRASKSVKNMVGVLSSVLASAKDDYGLIDANPCDGMFAHKRARRVFPQVLPGRGRHDWVLEPLEFRPAIEELLVRAERVMHMVLFATFTGLRWGEQVALRMDHDIDLRANVIHIDRAFYERNPQLPKGVPRDVWMSPLVRRILEAVPRKRGLVFSKDGVEEIGNGTWIKRMWLRAQERAEVRVPISWHCLRHQFVSLMKAAGKSDEYISEQAGHEDIRFTRKTYGHLFKTIRPTPVEWPEVLVWPSGNFPAIENHQNRFFPHISPAPAVSRRSISTRVEGADDEGSGGKPW